MPLRRKARAAAPRPATSEAKLARSMDAPALAKQLRVESAQEIVQQENLSLGEGQRHIPKNKALLQLIAVMVDTQP